MINDEYINDDPPGWKELPAWKEKVTISGILFGWVPTSHTAASERGGKQKGTIAFAAKRQIHTNNSHHRKGRMEKEGRLSPKK